jgi:hypothetical protein
MWWNDVGAVWGWGGCLLVLVALLAFWGVVVAGVMALFRTARPTMPPTVDAPPGESTHTGPVSGASRNARQESL